MSAAPARTALAWSGGKDSLLALRSLQADPAFAPVALVTTFAEPYRRISMHGVRAELAEAQAAALGLPLVKAWLPWPCNNDTYRRRFAEALAELRGEALDAVAFGDLFLEDIRAFREAQMRALGLAAAFPLWGSATAELAARFISEGHRAVTVCVDAEQLDPAFLGRDYDAEFVAALPPGIDPAGENGEFHSFVYDGPGFAHAIAFRPGRREVRDERFHYLDLVPPAGGRPV